jgi:hypothetical protein
MGLAVRLPTDCACGANTAVIGADAGGRFAAALTCSCGKHRGYLTEFTASFVEAVAKRFGAPETITLRRTIPPVEVEQPAGNAGTSSEEKSNA